MPNPNSRTANLPATVSAAPTKRFFISVLIKDIQFIDAVVELVDNSVDSARSGNGGPNLAGIVVEITHSNGSFVIRDNAQGISIEVARNYAFRFGRPENAPPAPGAVGEFGVGMKRALFKIGRHFVVRSSTTRDSFSVDVDVDAWESQPETDPNGWTFIMSESGQNLEGKTGTTILVDKLYDYANDELTSTNFDTRLIALLKEAHASSLTAGLQIVVNNHAVLSQPTTLLSSEEISPISYRQVIDVEGKEVTVQIIAGVGEPLLADAGWYVYCNGRQIERAEKTGRTGWNSAIDDGDRTPKPHWQFRRFRGYLFFTSDSADVLPWNTTKTGLNTEAPVYRRIRADMNSAMLQVIGFLNQLDAEPAEGPLSALVSEATGIELVNLAPNRNFTYKASTAPPQPAVNRINYTRPSDLAEAVKESLGVKSWREVGEQTFDYYVEAEDISG